MEAKTERFEMRLDPRTLERIDTWRVSQPDVPSRAEAIRRLVESGLADSPPQVSITDGERLIFMMLRDIYKTMKINGEIDPDFVASAILGGHSWGLEWEYTGLFHRHEDDRTEVTAVVDILDMWSFLEEGFEKLSTGDKKKIKDELGPLGTLVQFPGFDGNNEADRLNIALFLVNDLGRFERFKKRDLNSHHPTNATYGRMLPVFEKIRPSLVGRSLGVSELIAILKR